MSSNDHGLSEESKVAAHIGSRHYTQGPASEKWVQVKQEFEQQSVVGSTHRGLQVKDGCR
jgi:hypothetical protein